MQEEDASQCPVQVRKGFRAVTSSFSSGMASLPPSAASLRAPVHPLEVPAEEGHVRSEISDRPAERGGERGQVLSLPGCLLCPLPLLPYGHPCIRWKYRQRKATYDLRFQTDQPPMPRRQQGSFAGILLAHTIPSYAYSLAFAGIESSTWRGSNADLNISSSFSPEVSGKPIWPPCAADRQQAMMISKPAQALAKLQGWTFCASSSQSAMC